MKKLFLSLILPTALVACKGEPSISEAKSDQPTTTVEVSYEPFAAPKAAAEAEASLAIIKDRYDWSKVPKNLAVPTDREAAVEFARAVRTLRTTSGPDLVWLKALELSKLEGVTQINQRELKRSINTHIERLETSLPKDLAKSMKLTNAAFEQWISSQVKWVQQAADADPEKRDDVVNLLSREDIITRRERAGVGALENMEYAALIDEASGVESTWPARRKAFEPVLERCRANVAAASAGVKPPSGLDRPELENIAAGVLANKSYGIAKPERIIVKSDKRKRERVEFTVEDDSVVKITREWDEFQVATVEKSKGGGRELFYNDLRYYHRGASTTPVGEWVLGKRIRSAKIAD